MLLSWIAIALIFHTIVNSTDIETKCTDIETK